MTPASPVFPGVEITETVYARDQPQYKDLPALRTGDGRVFTRWSLTWRERVAVLLGGSVWLQVMTFNHPLQPVKITASCPIIEYLEGQ